MAAATLDRKTDQTGKAFCLGVRGELATHWWPRIGPDERPHRTHGRRRQGVSPIGIGEERRHPVGMSERQAQLSSRLGVRPAVVEEQLAGVVEQAPRRKVGGGVYRGLQMGQLHEGSHRVRGADRPVVDLCWAPQWQLSERAREQVVDRSAAAAAAAVLSQLPLQMRQPRELDDAPAQQQPVHVGLQPEGTDAVHRCESDRRLLREGRDQIEGFPQGAPTALTCLRRPGGTEDRADPAHRQHRRLAAWG